jgi:hypothetical protein
MSRPLKTVLVLGGVALGLLVVAFLVVLWLIPVDEEDSAPAATAASGAPAGKSSASTQPGGAGGGGKGSPLFVESSAEPLPIPAATGPSATRNAEGEVVPNEGAKVYYVRPSGGLASECTGLKNADYPGHGAGQPCAFKHPFIALPPSGPAPFKGGDTLVIARGSYAMGHGAPGASMCAREFPWDCHLPPLPSGRAGAPTRLLGEGFDAGCKAPPELYGVERAYRILDLERSSHVQIECLEVTDHSGCVESHSGGLACNRDKFPHGPWAAVGLRASDSKDVVLRHLDIHGLADRGVLAGRLEDWTLEDVRIAGNGWAGWDGDLAEGGKESGDSGKMVFRRVTVEWNGCGETYPGGKPAGCWGQTAGGYGDGFGTASTGGDWFFEDCKFLHNTSDGLDLLYHDKGGTIVVDRVRAEGNAGNPVKITGTARVTNSVMVANCAFFTGKPFTHNVDACRAYGNTLELVFVEGARITLANSTLYGQGDVLVNVAAREGHGCTGRERLLAVNNVFVGDVEYLSPTDRTALYYEEGCRGLKFEEDYGVAHAVKGDCKRGEHDLCADPLLGPLSGEEYGMVPRAGSPAIDSGLPVGGLVPAVDITGARRPHGKGVDRGAYEVGAARP